MNKVLHISFDANVSVSPTVFKDDNNKSSIFEIERSILVNIDVVGLSSVMFGLLNFNSRLLENIYTNEIDDPYTACYYF